MKIFPLVLNLSNTDKTLSMTSEAKKPQILIPNKSFMPISPSTPNYNRSVPITQNFRDKILIFKFSLHRQSTPTILFEFQMMPITDSNLKIHLKFKSLYIRMSHTPRRVTFMSQLKAQVSYFLHFQIIRHQSCMLRQYHVKDVVWFPMDH